MSVLTGLKVILKSIAELCSLEFLGLCTVIAPPLFASIGFFFGKTITPWYFYGVVLVLVCCSFCVGWRRGFAYFIMLILCVLLTAFTFSYVGTDAQNYHFPMQYLLKNGWNPVFDSTVEKFAAIAGDANLSVYHTLFLPKFSSLCGAIVASAFGLFSGDGFLGYMLVVCLFVSSIKFARRYLDANIAVSIIFAMGMTFSTKITSFLAGQVDYTVYASFCIASMSLVLYAWGRKIGDLAVFAIASCICMSSKTTGILCCFVLIVMTLPMLYRCIGYWRVLIIVGIVVAIIGASPLLTSWIQYGSPFYPSMTFDPRMSVVDITSDFTGNEDALSMGLLARICYAWVSPDLTVAAIRFLEGNSSFKPVFTVCGGVTGFGMWFNILLLVSIVLLLSSRKNLITLLCVIAFISSNFAPLKYIGYGRYFPQIWVIFPLAVLNFVCTTKSKECNNRLVKVIKNCAIYGLYAILLSMSVLSFARIIAYQGRMLVQERYRQDLIATFQSNKPVRVNKRDYKFTNVARFKQAGVSIVKSDDGVVDTVMQKDSALPCYDKSPEVYDNLNRYFPICNSVRSLICDFKWFDVIHHIPHVLWD